jgi:hypothetical protein
VREIDHCESHSSLASQCAAFPFIEQCPTDQISNISNKMILSIVLLLSLLLINAESSFLQPLKAPRNIEDLNRFVSYFLNPRDNLVVNGSQQQFAAYLNNLTTGRTERDEYDSWDNQTRAEFMETLHKSRTVAGKSDALYFGRFIEKLSTGTCTNTLVLGGSLTCGHKLKTDNESNEIAYPELFEG